MKPDKETAKKLLAIRDAIIENDTSEAYHQLMLLADPDLINHEHWKEWEQIANVDE